MRTVDETEADDGATHRFWLFIAALRRRRDPPRYAFNLERIERLREAVDAFNESGGVA